MALQSSHVALAQAEQPFVLTLDAGTSSARAQLHDGRGRLVEGLAATESYTVHVSADGAAEDDADAAVARLARVIDKVLAQAVSLPISAVAISTLATTFVPLDANLRPLMPLTTYADTRSASDSEALRRQLDERVAHERTGCLLRTSYWPSRLAWLRRTQPELRPARFVTLGEYIELCLFGECRLSYSAASWTGLLDRRALTWDAPLLDVLGQTPQHFSPLVDFNEPLQGLQALYAERWPALHAIPWFPAVGDGAAANIGSGCDAPGRIALTVGTTGALRVVLPDVPQVPPGLWCYRVDRRRALLGGATSEGGNVYAWMQHTTRLGEPAAVEAALAAMQPDGHGLTFLPFLAGERSPGWAGDARAAINGLTLSTTPLELLRAGLEAVAYRFALIAEQLGVGQDDATQHAPVIASGGALLSSPTWMQIVADTLGRPVAASIEAEASSRGVAVLALEALGAIASVGDLPAGTGASYAPDPQRYPLYRAAIERQRQLYDVLVVRSA